MKLEEILSISLMMLDKTCEIFPVEHFYVKNDKGFISSTCDYTEDDLVADIRYQVDHKQINFDVYSGMNLLIVGKLSIDTNDLTLIRTPACAFANAAVRENKLQSWHKFEDRVKDVFMRHLDILKNTYEIDQEKFLYSYTENDIKNVLKNSFDEYSIFKSTPSKHKVNITTTIETLSVTLFYVDKDDVHSDFSIRIEHINDKHVVILYEGEYHVDLGGFFDLEGNKPAGFDEGIKPYLLLFSLVQ